MTPRQKRMTLVFGIIVGVSIAGALALTAFRQNVTFFFDPTAVAQGQVPAGERFRLGGMVTKGSVQRAPGSLEVHFVVTDFKHDVPVSYTGVLPDLFREGQGVVAHGRMTGGTFVADEVLAKHDEKYMPPEVARSLKKREAEATPTGSATATGAPGTGVGASAPEVATPPAGASIRATPPTQGAASAPGNTTIVPGRASTTPATASTAPGIASTAPGTATTAPGTATTAPGTASTAPGTATTAQATR